MMNISYCLQTVLFLALCIAGCGGGDAGGNPPVNNSNPPVAGWQRQSENPLIVPILTNTIQDHGPADPSILFDNEDNKWKAWFSSTLEDRVSGVKTITIRYTESADGVHWSNPQTVFQTASDSNAWDYTNVETPDVIKNPNPMAPAEKKYMLWYSGANTTLAASENRPSGPGALTYYQIGLAYSPDGKIFTRHLPGLNNKPGLVLVANASLFGAALPGTFGDGTTSDPEVIFKDGMFHMWLSSYAESVPDPVTPNGRLPLAFGIAHMTSSDGVIWNTNHSNPLASLFKPGDVAGGRDPSVLFNQNTNQYEMWFTNDTLTDELSIPCHFNTVIGFWHAVSNDGIQWTTDYTKYDLRYDTQYRYEALGFLRGIDVVMVSGHYQAYYSAFGTERIPDSSIYLCPDQQNNPIPAVLSLNRATYISP